MDHWSLGRRGMFARAIQTRNTSRYKARPSTATSEPLICSIVLQLLLCQVDRALQLALCHLESTRAYLPNTQQLCRRSKSGKQRHCLLRSPAEWFSRYSLSTPHLPKHLPPLRMRCVRTSYACHVVCASVVMASCDTRVPDSPHHVTMVTRR